MWALGTRGEPNEIKRETTHPEHITALFRHQVPSIHLIGISCEFKGVSENLASLFVNQSDVRHFLYVQRVFCDP